MCKKAKSENIKKNYAGSTLAIVVITHCFLYSGECNNQFCRNVATMPDLADHGGFAYDYLMSQSITTTVSGMNTFTGQYL